MGCAGSRPDPSAFLVAQPEPAAPIGPVAGGDVSTSDYTSVENRMLQLVDDMDATKKAVEALSETLDAAVTKLSGDIAGIKEGLDRLLKVNAGP